MKLNGLFPTTLTPSEWVTSSAQRSKWPGVPGAAIPWRKTERRRIGVRSLERPRVYLFLLHTRGPFGVTRH